jgi:hypothetical protein
MNHLKGINTLHLKAHPNPNSIRPFLNKPNRILTPDGYIEPLHYYNNSTDLKTFVTFYNEKREPEYTIEHRMPKDTDVCLRQLLLKTVVYQPELAYYYSVDLVTEEMAKTKAKGFSGNYWPFNTYWQGYANKSYTVSDIYWRLRKRNFNEVVEIAIYEDLNIVVNERDMTAKKLMAYQQYLQCIDSPSAVGNIIFGIGYLGRDILVKQLH